MEQGLIIELKTIKNDINKISERFDYYSEEAVINNIKMILKRCILLKYLLENTTDYHINASLTDLIYLLRSVESGEHRYFYFNIRSLIEHFLRIFNDIDPHDENYNFQLIEQTKLKIKQMNITDINIGVIVSQYKKSCNYIHGNIKAGMPVLLFYNEFSDRREQLKRSIIEFSKLNNELFKLLLYSKHELIDASFHRKKAILRYLTNEKYLVKLRQLDS